VDKDDWDFLNAEVGDPFPYIHVYVLFINGGQGLLQAVALHMIMLRTD
jgi:hypothetical protein